MPSVPHRADEEYFIVAMDWWQKWIKYTDYEHLVIDEDGITPGDDISTQLTLSSV
jgi:hypothetical protein